MRSADTQLVRLFTLLLLVSDATSGSTEEVPSSSAEPNDDGTTTSQVGRLVEFELKEEDYGIIKAQIVAARDVPAADGTTHQLRYLSVSLPDEWVALDFTAGTLSDTYGHLDVLFRVMSSGEAPPATKSDSSGRDGAAGQDGVLAYEYSPSFNVAHLVANTSNCSSVCWSSATAVTMLRSDGMWRLELLLGEATGSCIDNPEQAEARAVCQCGRCVGILGHSATSMDPINLECSDGAMASVHREEDSLIASVRPTVSEGTQAEEKEAEIAKLEVEKRAAVEAEDYEAAKKLKNRIDKLKQNHDSSESGRPAGRAGGMAANPMLQAMMSDRGMMQEMVQMAMAQDKPQGMGGMGATEVMNDPKMMEQMTAMAVSIMENNPSILAAVGGSTLSDTPAPAAPCRVAMHATRGGGVLGLRQISAPKRHLDEGSNNSNNNSASHQSETTVAFACEPECGDARGASEHPAADADDWKWIVIEGRNRTIEVAYLQHLDGGGTLAYQDYIHYFRQAGLRAHRLFEWCAGPGFIGFALLAEGLAETLVLADVNPLAARAAVETMRRNGLQEIVTLYLSDGLDSVADEELNSWDVVVGNPPHFSRPRPVAMWNHVGVDIGWRLHERFYADVGRFLTGGANVVIMEDPMGSTEHDWLPMLPKGLSPVRAKFVHHGLYFFRVVAQPNPTAEAPTE